MSVSSFNWLNQDFIGSEKKIEAFLFLDLFFKLI